MEFIRFIIKKISLLIMASLLAACSLDYFSPGEDAPIVEGWKETAFSGDYRVQPGDTIYSIAWSFGVDYRDLAQFNHLSQPYSLQTGQWVRMSSVKPQPVIVRQIQEVAIKSPKSLATPKPISGVITKNKQKSKNVAQKEVIVSQVIVSRKVWQWPTTGKIIRGYSSAFGGNRGIDILGKLNQPVLAAAPGKVVYTGSSIPGYGKLIIIKHNDNELSAYAFNQTLSVTEGQEVKIGQTIASMGKNEQGQNILHFEIRLLGKPVNPEKYLPSRK